VVADLLSRRPDYEERLNRKKAILKETEQGWTINEHAELKTIQNFDLELLKEIAKCQQNDKRCKKGTLNEETGMWTFQGAIIVPEKLEKDFIQENHDGPLRDHTGEARTVERI
jgi:hypothetical protein